jgi:hypothetical protein
MKKSKFAESTSGTLRSYLGCGLLRMAACGLSAMLLAGPAFAQLDPEESKPYQLRIVVGFSKHPLLTPAFKEEVRREIRGSFDAAFGNAGLVEVIDKEQLKELATHSSPAAATSLRQSVELLDSVEANGLEEGFRTTRQVSDTKTHFVWIEFKNDRYEISGRQYDGTTALASPVVRQAATYDRQFVARAATLLIERDFGVVGTIRDRQGDQVEVALKAGALARRPEPWVKRGDVLAISQIQQAPEGQRGYRMEWTLLRAADDAKNGVCRCVLSHRYAGTVALPQTSSILGYRCIKLGTGHAPLRLRLFNEKTRTPKAFALVNVSQGGFDSKEQEHLSSNAAGLVQTRRDYQDIAYVNVLGSSGNRPLAQLPVEILDRRTVTCEVSESAEAESLGQLESARDELIRRIGEALLRSVGLFRQLKKFDEENLREEALQAAHAGLKDMDTAATGFGIEIANFRKEAQDWKADIRDKLLAPCERGLERFKEDRKQLREYSERLEDVIHKEKDPVRKKLQELAASIQLREQEADYDKAIELYEEMDRLGKGLPAVKPFQERLEKLKKQWKLKDEDHKKARDFIYTSWPKLTSALDLKEHMAEAKKALAKCILVEDRLTPERLLRANIDHFNRLAKRLEAVANSDNPDDRTEGKAILDVRGDLEELTKQASNFIRKDKAASAK